MLAGLRGYEWIVLLLIVVLLFGAKRLPDTARGLGRSLRILKAETKGLRDDDADVSDTSDVHVAPIEQRAIQNPPVPPAQQPAPQQAPTSTGHDAIER
jgi:sec-independent protein translocase protein TatA